MLGGEGLVTVPQDENLKESKEVGMNLERWSTLISSSPEKDHAEHVTRVWPAATQVSHSWDGSSHNQSCHTVSFHF